MRQPTNLTRPTPVSFSKHERMLLSEIDDEHVDLYTGLLGVIASQDSRWTRSIRCEDSNQQRESHLPVLPMRESFE